jgi:hypothetical protein
VTANTIGRSKKYYGLAGYALGRIGLSEAPACLDAVFMLLNGRNVQSQLHDFVFEEE